MQPLKRTDFFCDFLFVLCFLFLVAATRKLILNSTDALALNGAFKCSCVFGALVALPRVCRPLSAATAAPLRSIFLRAQCIWDTLFYLLATDQGLHD